MANTLRFKRGLVATIPTAAAGEPLFTTDTFDLYIGNGTGNTMFQKYIASGATTQILRGDGSLYNFPLAISSATNGQVLKFNGTNWVNDSDAGITGSGSAGQVAYFTGATTQTGSNNLFWDNTNVRLGVGTNNPAYTFHTISSAATIGAFRNSGAAIGQLLVGNTAGDLQVRILASGDGYILSDTGKYLAFGSNGLERARIFSGGNVAINSTTDNGLRFQVTGDGYFSGNVGVGTTPSYKLHVAGNLYVNHNDAPIATFVRNGGSDTNTVIAFSNATTTTYFGTNGTLFGMGGSTGAITNQPFIIVPSATEKLRLDASGNLGLGVVPSGWISVYRAFNIGAKGFVYSRTDTDETAIGTNWYRNSAAAFLYSTNGNASLYAQTTGQHQWFNAPSGTAGGTVTFTQAMTLTANGRLLLGTTSEGTQRLQVAGDSHFNGVVYVNTTTQVSGVSAAKLVVTQTAATADWTATIKGGTTSGGSYGLRIDAGTTSGDYPLVIYNSAATSMLAVNGVGNVGIGTTSPTVIAGYTTLAVNNATNGGNIDLMTAGTRHASWNNTATETYFGTRSNTPLAFTTNATEVAKFYANGNFRVGAAGADSGERLQVTGTMKVTGASTFARITTTTSGVTLDYNSGILYHAGGSGSYYQFISGANYYISNRTATGSLVLRTQDIDRLTIDSAGAATFSSSVTAGGFITSGGTGYAVINSAATTVTAIRPTGGGASIMSTNSNGLHIAVGTQAAGDLILASNNTERIRLSTNGFFSQLNATNPSGSITDSYIQYSADVVAGNAAPHFRTENGAIIKLYQETTAVGNAIFSQGGGNSVLDDSTFAGYTIRQVVQALRNQGILQ